MNSLGIVCRLSNQLKYLPETTKKKVMRKCFLKIKMENPH